MKNLALLSVLYLLSFRVVFAADFDTVVPMVKKNVTTYYVSGSYVGSDESDFLIDTGAGISSINEETLNKLQKSGDAVFKKMVSASLANGNEVKLAVYQIASLRIGDSCLVKNVEAIVLPNKTRNILGLNALEKMAPFAMSVNPPRLMLSQCEEKLQHVALK